MTLESSALNVTVTATLMIITITGVRSVIGVTMKRYQRL